MERCGQAQRSSIGRQLASRLRGEVHAKSSDVADTRSKGLPVSSWCERLHCHSLQCQVWFERLGGMVVVTGHQSDSKGAVLASDTENTPIVHIVQNNSVACHARPRIVSKRVSDANCLDYMKLLVLGLWKLWMTPVSPFPQARAATLEQCNRASNFPLLSKPLPCAHDMMLRFWTLFPLSLDPVISSIFTTDHSISFLIGVHIFSTGLTLLSHVNGTLPDVWPHASRALS